MNLELSCGAKIEADVTIGLVRIWVDQPAALTGVTSSGRDVELTSCKILIDGDDLKDIANFFDDLVKEYRLRGEEEGDQPSMTVFTIEFSPKADDELKLVAERLGVKSKVDVLRKALALLNYVTGEQQKGSKLYLENERLKLKKEIVMI